MSLGDELTPFESPLGEFARRGVNEKLPLVCEDPVIPTFGIGISGRLKKCLGFFGFGKGEYVVADKGLEFVMLSGNPNEESVWVNRADFLNGVFNEPVDTRKFLLASASVRFVERRFRRDSGDFDSTAISCFMLLKLKAVWRERQS